MTPTDATEKPWTTAYAAPGETVAFASSGHGGDLVIGDPVIHDVVFVHGSLELLAMDEAACAVLDEEEAYFDGLMRDLLNAQAMAAARPPSPATAGVSDPDVAAAKEAIAAEIEAIVKTSGVELTEIRRMSGRKWTYVRSDRLRNHWRSYRLDVDDRDASIRNAGPDGSPGSINRRKLIEQATDAEAALKLAEHTFVEGTLTDFMGEWFDEMRASLSGQTDLVGEGEERMLDRFHEAQLLRYYAGTSLAGEFSLRDRRFGFKGELGASFALAEGRLGVNGYLPHASGWRLRVPPPPGHAVGVLDLGAIRFHGEAVLKGFVGASVAGGVEAKVTMSQGKALVRAARPGDSPAGGSARGADGQVASASARAFAGAEGGVELKGSLEWDNPDERGGGAPSWQAFLSLGAEGAGAFGVGAEAGFTVSYERGRFMVRAEAGLVLGGGLKGKVAFEVGVGVLAEFVAFVYHKLRDANYRHLHWIDEVAFLALSRLVAHAIAEGVDLAVVAGEFLGGQAAAAYEGASGVVGRVVAAHGRRRDSQRLAANVRRADGTRYATPEAKAMLLDRLMEAKAFRAYAEEAEEEAAIAVLRWVQSRREFREVCEHLGPGATKTSYEGGRARLDAFFDGADARRYQRVQTDLAARDRLIQDMSQWVGDPLLHLYRSTAPPDSAVIPNARIR